MGPAGLEREIIVWSLFYFFIAYLFSSGVNTPGYARHSDKCIFSWASLCPLRWTGSDDQYSPKPLHLGFLT
jgi:hypothetical protein